MPNSRRKSPSKGLKRSYAWQSKWGIERAFEYYERAARQDAPSIANKKRKRRTVDSIGHVSEGLRSKVKDIVEAVDDEGRWLRDEMISSEVFVRNTHVLCDYLEALGNES